MEITRTSNLTGVTRTMDLNVTQEQLDQYESGDVLIQDVLPHLTPAEREFIMTGITDEEWKQFMTIIDDDDVDDLDEEKSNFDEEYNGFDEE